MMIMIIIILNDLFFELRPLSGICEYLVLSMSYHTKQLNNRNRFTINEQFFLRCKLRQSGFRITLSFTLLCHIFLHHFRVVAIDVDGVGKPPEVEVNITIRCVKVIRVKHVVGL